MSPSRRRSHPLKLVFAVALLCVAAIVACVALLTATVPALTTATILGVVAGVVAAGLMFAEIAVMRRMWAHDRAKLVDGYRVAARERQASQLAFVEHVSQQIQTRDTELDLQRTQLLVLREQIVDVEIEMALARERLAEEQARVQALQDDAEAAASDLASAQADLVKAKDALAASEAAGVAARAEIVAWEQAAADPGHQRRTA